MNLCDLIYIVIIGWKGSDCNIDINECNIVYFCSSGICKNINGSF